MTIEVKVPVLPESVADATVVAWHKAPGDPVSRDENLVDLETEKVVLEVPSPVDGVLGDILKPEGETVVSDEVLASITKGAATPKVGKKEVPALEQAMPSGAAAAAVAPAMDNITELSPAVRRLVSEHAVDTAQLVGSGKGGRLTKEDIMKAIDQQKAKPATKKPAAKAVPAEIVSIAGERTEKRVPFSRIRARIAERLLQAQQNAAILTTFNEVNLQAVIDLRKKYKVQFEKKHGVKLGFMSFFTKAVTEALKRFPAVNASVDGNDVVYHGYYDIGIAVSTERGLVVPILRDADRMKMSEIEASINDYATRARAGQLTIEEMTGGTFTITNGGVFGSMLSTPILNPPQTAILGMHKIEQRPVVEDGEIVARPMMYLALSYDHRLIDGKESVQFLVAIKEMLEYPAGLLLDL